MVNSMTCVGAGRPDVLPARARLVALWQHHGAWAQPGAWLLVALSVLGSVPLLLSPYPPGMDWPEHVAILDVLVRLWRGDGAVAAHYAFAPQALGYHLFYLAAFPFALVLGAARAVQLVMVAVLWAHVGACFFWLRRRRRSVVLACGGLVSFYGAHFTYGFVVTMVATPFVLVVVAELAAGAQTVGRGVVRGMRRRRWALGCCAAAAALGHVVFVPYLALASLVAVVAHGRRAFSDVASVVAGLALAAGPGLGLRAIQTWRGGRASTSSFDSLMDGYRHFIKWTYAIDHHGAQVGLLVFLVACLAAALIPTRRFFARPRCVLAGCALVSVSCLWALPFTTSGPLGESLLLNVRWLALLPPLLAMLAAEGAARRGAILRYALDGTVAGATLCVLLGALRLSAAFAADTAPFRRAIATLPKGARMVATSEVVTVGSCWPTVRFNMTLMAYPGRLAAHSGIFVGGHLPLRERVPGAAATAARLLQDYLGATGRGDTEAPAQTELWTACDVAMVQGPKVDGLPALDPRVGVELARGRGWRLFGPPPAAPRP